jgi:cysteine desulfuration protein SufE
MSIADQAESLRDDMAVLDTWEARFAHLIDLGKALPPLGSEDYCEANKVRGCSSQVWLVAEASPCRPGALRLRGASDSMIVAGLVAVMVHLFSDQSPDDVVRFDAPTFFKDIGLADALTPQRSNGLAAMLARIRSLARSADENNAA